MKNRRTNPKRSLGINRLTSVETMYTVHDPVALLAIGNTCQPVGCGCREGKVDGSTVAP